MIVFVAVFYQRIRSLVLDTSFFRMADRHRCLGWMSLGLAVTLCTVTNHTYTHDLSHFSCPCCVPVLRGITSHFTGTDTKRERVLSSTMH
jgi:hypothetical protein